MYTIKTRHNFDSAHFLKDYDGKCRNIHGHRWIVEIEVCSNTIQTDGDCRGMVVDFSTLKAELKSITQYLDHSLIIEKDSLKKETLKALLSENFNVIEFDFRPTAENLAKYIYTQIKNKNYNIARATVYETPKNCASYSEE